MLALDYTPDSNLCSELVVRIKTRIPGVKILFKDTSFRRFFHSDKWKNRVSVTRCKIWLPSKNVYNNSPVAFKMLSYGYALCLDMNDRPLVWWIFFLIPYYRALVLSRGYAAVLAVNIWRHGSLLPKTKEWITKRMTVRNKDHALSIVNEYEGIIHMVDAVRGDNFLNYSEAYRDIYEILTGIEREDL